MKSIISGAEFIEENCEKTKTSNTLILLLPICHLTIRVLGHALEQLV
jgi:hypothetical protein